MDDLKGDVRLFSFFPLSLVVNCERYLVSVMEVVNWVEYIRNGTCDTSSGIYRAKCLLLRLQVSRFHIVDFVRSTIYCLGPKLASRQVEVSARQRRHVPVTLLLINRGKDREGKTVVEVKSHYLCLELGGTNPDRDFNKLPTMTEDWKLDRDEGA